MALISVSFANAQKHDRNRDHQKDFSSMTPKKGDLATGIDLAGAVKFIGNSFADNKMEEEPIKPFGGGAFFAKYFLTDNIALRARLGVNASNYTVRRFVRDDIANALGEVAEVTDTKKTNTSGFDFAVGVEFRRTLRRVQGYVGIEAFIGTASNKTAYEYGNAITVDNKYPTNAFFDPYYGRVLNESSSTTRGGFSIFMGVDYFLSRNVSLGFEFGLFGYGSSYKYDGVEYEVWDYYTDVYKRDTEDKMPKQNQFNINSTASVNLMFYF